jgi:type II secretion system protein I
VTARGPRRPTRPAAGSAGFTLLEVLVALAILGTAVVVSIQGVSQGLRLLQAAGDQQRAMIVADQRAREMLVPTEGTESGTDGRFSWQRISKVLETPELAPANAAQKWRVFEISVVVTWEGQRRLEVATLRTVPATSDPTRQVQAIGVPAGGSPATGPGGAPTGGGTPMMGLGAPPRSGSPPTTGSGAVLPGRTAR